MSTFVVTHFAKWVRLIGGRGREYACLTPEALPVPRRSLPGEGGPPSVVVVRILSVRPNTDLEGDDDYVPYYDNHADIYGTVTIDGEKFSLPRIDDNDHPHWETLGPKSGVFEKEVTSGTVPISIDIWEGDSGATFEDDHVDINPSSSKHRLDFDFDLCSLTLSGDVSGASQSLIESSGGTGSDAATILFTVGMKDGRPVTQDDLALVDIDLIQVVPRSSRLVAGKGTVVMIRIANNYRSPVATDLQVRVSGGGVSVNETIPIQLAAGEVKKEYLFTSNPIVSLRPTMHTRLPFWLRSSTRSPRRCRPIAVCGRMIERTSGSHGR
ncbi:MAG TPA: hypothetical protein VF028_11500 [Actinomycetota bacterium]|nr:hypothetical protein [Actinomycetota bacterium]